MFEMELAGKDDQIVMIKVVNQGIDSRLEGFTKSSFEWRYIHLEGDELELSLSGRQPLIEQRLHCRIHPDEMSVLLRRLVEIWERENDKSAGALADIIMHTRYEEHERN